MSKYSILALPLLAVLSFASLMVAAKDMPSPDGEKVWTYISQKNPYVKWEKWPGYPGMYPGESPHGAYLKLYVNAIALNAIQEKKEIMPQGAVIVKENYGEDQETLIAVTPMYKVKGYNPEAGNWFWAKYGADGKVMAEGKVKGCIDCHSKRKENDWIFTESR
ncbi:MAG: cytochrome P460 family protein [Candidatus Aminicenantes bacterium]